MVRVNLISLQTDNTSIEWSLGRVFPCSPNVKAFSECLECAFKEENADAWLIWDSTLKLPTTSMVLSLLDQSIDVWHAGLALGLEGKPEMIDFVSPTWMLNRDPDKSIDATSWRLSLRACLVRSEVFRQLGGPRIEFESLEAAGLELGLRFIRRGAFVLHVPGLVPDLQLAGKKNISLHDQLLFINSCFGSRWTRWAMFRALWTHYLKLPELLRTWRVVRTKTVPEPSLPFQHTAQVNHDDRNDMVSVLIPTLRRYPYLRVLLNQLRDQTVPAFEILVMDQTPKGERDPGLMEEFSDLPLHWYFLDQPGQCSSRNLGLQKARGEYILFLDDDDEIEADLIEKHLSNLARFQNDVSNGVAIETGIGGLPEDFGFVRVSDVFPTNNTLIRKSVLQKSGLFDLAYDLGQRADHDLGLRLYIKGELMVLNPGTSVLHHHAPMGGLREHKARIDTYAASRRHILKQVLPSVSDLYLNYRYFSSRQVRERIWIDLFGTFSMKGSPLQRLLKGLIAAIALPRNIRIVRQRAEIARQLLRDYPQIPGFLEEKP